MLHVGTTCSTRRRRETFSRTSVYWWSTFTRWRRTRLARSCWRECLTMTQACFHIYRSHKWKISAWSRCDPLCPCVFAGTRLRLVGLRKRKRGSAGRKGFWPKERSSSRVWPRRMKCPRSENSHFEDVLSAFSLIKTCLLFPFFCKNGAHSIPVLLVCTQRVAAGWCQFLQGMVALLPQCPLSVRAEIWFGDMLMVPVITRQLFAKDIVWFILLLAKTNVFASMLVCLFVQTFVCLFVCDPSRAHGFDRNDLNIFQVIA